ncbi:MAG: biopolymer transporter Tol [Verrucomicrobiota bacterium]
MQPPIQNILILVISLFVFVQHADSQTIDIGEAVGTGGDAMLIAVESSDAGLLDLAQRAFNIHGGYKLTTKDRAAFVLGIERASGPSVTLTIGSGKTYVEQLRKTVRGSDMQNAALRACDLAVKATLGIDGFFAGKLAFVGKQRGISEIYTSSILFTGVRALTADRSLVTGPSWSPDGSRLLYTTYYKTGFPDIYMMDLRSNQKRPVATFKGLNTGARFSPDGNRIAMSLSGTGNSEIYVSDLQGRNLKRLTSNRSLEASPSWSPDARRLVFTSDAPGKPQLYEISVNGGPSQKIPTNVSSYCSEPAWNPVNSDLIAFTAAVAGGFQIAVYDFKTRKSTILTSGASSVEPAWTNDGRHLVFTERRNGRTRLMLLDTKSKKVSALHNPNFGDASSASFVY